jgi:hypothetical protein
VKYGSTSCPHRDLTKDWAAYDYAACNELFSKMKTMLLAVFEEDSIDIYRETILVIQLTNVAELYEFECRNNDFSNERKQILRELALAEGTRIVRSKANKMDLTKEETIYEALPFVFLLTTVQVSEKHKAQTGIGYLGEIVHLLHDIINCP